VQVGAEFSVKSRGDRSAGERSSQCGNDLTDT